MHLIGNFVSRISSSRDATETEEPIALVGRKMQIKTLAGLLRVFQDLSPSCYECLDFFYGSTSFFPSTLLWWLENKSTVHSKSNVKASRNIGQKIGFFFVFIEITVQDKT